MDGLFFLGFLILSDHVWGLGFPSECGIPVSEGKIVGGVDSGGYQYPWFALLLLKKNSFLPVPVCAGTLITSLHILTAAHCFTISATVENQDLFSVALGVYDICRTTEDTRQIFNVDSVAVHEKYQKRGKFYDIALIKLDRKADYTFICLPLFGVPDITEVALLIGFGVTEENSNFVPCHMLQANVTKYSKKDCSSSKLPLEDKKEPSVICAGTFTGKIDSCYGDSGGPLQTLNSDGKYVIAGIVSYGYGCATPGAPGVYTNVGSYIQWIKNKISSLGSEKRSSTIKQNTRDVNDLNRGGLRRKQNSGVVFPEQKSVPNSTTDRKLPVNVDLFDKKNWMFNGTNFYESERNQKNQSDRLKKSRVVFPQ